MSIIALEVGQNAPPVCLWKENPYRLVSWWEMQFYASKAIRAMELLARAEVIAQLGGGLEINSPTHHEQVAKTFDDLAEVLRELEMEDQAARASDIAAFSRKHHKNPQHEELRVLSVLVHHDLNKCVFEAVPHSRSAYYAPESIFGNAVSNNFASARYDINEAGKCYALSRWTASVFHLMRCLEVGLATFAKRFDVVFDHANWNTIIEQIQKAIKGIASDSSRPPDWKEQQEAFSQAASYFVVFKDAWRNYTMHARGTYGEEDAKRIFVAVAAFMSELAKHLHD